MLRLTASFAFVLVSAALAGCGGGVEIDPLGTWVATITYGNGGVSPCNFTGADTAVFSVTQDPSGLVIGRSNGNPGVATVTIPGEFTCGAGSCEFSGTDVRPDAGSIETTSYDLTFKADGSLSGGGTIGYSPESCSQAFTVTGTKS